MRRVAELIGTAVLIVAACSPSLVSTASDDPASAGPSGAPTTAPSGGPSLTPASVPPTAAPLATTEPVSPSWTPRPPEALLLESLITVKVAELNVRDRPTTSGKIVGLVKKGQTLRVIEYGPFSHDGYPWYEVAFVAKAGNAPTSATVDVRNVEGIRGWIAVGKGDTAWVSKLKPRCPATIDLASIRYLLGSELLACYGNNTIELTGTFGCGGCGGMRPGSFEPGWLTSPLGGIPLAVYPVTDNMGSIGLRFPPGGAELPAEGSVLRVRGHFDDPIAGSCAISVIDPVKPTGETLVAVAPASAQLICRQQFVVESIVVVGTDPGFPTG
jgi:hypothetical protein